jgi:light-regulated signal transduction histidine kinase (bacteriophytochrome)
LQRLLIRYVFIFIISCVLAYVTLRTVSELQQAKQKIQKLNADLQHQAVELQATNKELEAFSYSVSHDLRAPLRSVDGFSQALLDDYADKLDEEGKDCLHKVQASAREMAELIDDMLTLFRVTRREMRFEAVNMSAIARAIAAKLQKSQPERHVQFVIADGMVVNGDSGLLQAALENLMGNAWKFTGKRPEATIELGAIPHNGSRAYFVRDDGAGFDMAYADKLFSPFQRLHRQTEFPGTGIGLATVQRIIHRHGGQAWAQGEVEKGAAFYFTLLT